MVKLGGAIRQKTQTGGSKFRRRAAMRREQITIVNTYVPGTVVSTLLPKFI